MRRKKREKEREREKVHVMIPQPRAYRRSGQCGQRGSSRRALRNGGTIKTNCSVVQRSDILIAAWTSNRRGPLAKPSRGGIANHRERGDFLFCRVVSFDFSNRSARASRGRKQYNNFEASLLWPLTWRAAIYSSSTFIIFVACRRVWMSI